MCKPEGLQAYNGKGSSNDYIIGTISMHTLDNRAGDGDGYVANPYPSSGGDTPTPTPTQISSSNVYDAALGATQASLNQLFNEKAHSSDTYTKTQVDNLLNGKQNTISDLGTIRNGASKGMTSLQEITQQEFNEIFN